MRNLSRFDMLGGYDVLLAIGAIWIGFQMVTMRGGTIFAEPYPESWAMHLPFVSWVVPGILAIGLFGFGNLLAAYFCWKKMRNAAFASAFIGTMMLVGLSYQYAAVGEMYIVTDPLLLIGLIQLGLSGYVFWCGRVRGHLGNSNVI